MTPQKIIKVLVTGAGALLGQGIIKSLRKSVLPLHIVAVDPSELAAGLYWSDRAYLVPMAHDPNYMNEVRQILECERPDIVLIGTDAELVLFASQREELERDFQTNILVSSSEVATIADDKWLTYQFLKNQGFNYPESCLPGNEETLIESVGFPLIVKPRVGARSIGVHIVQSKMELQAAIKQVGAPIIQECVGSADEEYTAGALVFNQQCSASIVMRRDLRDGNTYRAYTGEYKDYNRFIRMLAETLQPYGPVNFQARGSSKGLTVFEINCRFSGTTPLRVLAGFNEVEMCVRHILLNEPIIQPTIRPISILRHWSETIVDDALSTNLRAGIPSEMTE